MTWFSLESMLDMTPAFWYSLTRRSKKLVLPCSEMSSIQSNGLALLYSLGASSATSSRSAQNSMYSDIIREFMPIRSTESASQTNSFSCSTASPMMWCSSASVSLFSSMLYSRHAKSQCMPSSREISSFEKVSPGMRPRFLSQKIAQNEPEKKMPSTVANATSRSAKRDDSVIHFSAQSAFFLTQGTVSSALNSRSFSTVSLMYVSISKLYVSAWMFSIAIWKP
mmetsp:Transcript_34634/g.81771  ORF Transcript_34634/g.81771 Transcript_34634/m.81771 type:complete len:224 (-) Transcript_34634:367-1038(-)